MTIFLLISAAMLAVAVIFLAPALLRSKHDINEATSDHNVKIAQERLSELEIEHKKGETSDEEFSQAKQDLEIALAQDLSTSNSLTEHNDNRKTALGTLLLVALLIPAIVVPLYQDLGSPQHLDVVGPGTPKVAQKENKAPEIADLLGKLEKRLIAEPNNPQGWYMLGRSYMRLKQYENAVRSFESLNKIKPNDADVMLSLADALAMQNGGALPPRTAELLQKVLLIEPSSTTALWLSGIVEIDAGRPENALSYWHRAYPLLAGNTAMQSKLGGMIRQLEQQTGESSDASSIPTAQQTQSLENTSVTTTRLKLEIAIDAEVMAQASPTDTVFIYAKAINGPPIPLAVARKTVAELPITVVLTDDMAMMPQMKLSSFPQVKVGARITKSGRPIAQSGDLQSIEVETASNTTETLRLLINSRVN